MDLSGPRAPLPLLLSAKVASVITIPAQVLPTQPPFRLSVAAPIPRCCLDHRDWAILTRHLIADYGDVPTRIVVEEVTQAQNATRFFGLADDDARDCAEMIVRHRVHSATGRM